MLGPMKMHVIANVGWEYGDGDRGGGPEELTEYGVHTKQQVDVKWK